MTDLSKNRNVLGVKTKIYKDCDFCNDEEEEGTINIPFHIWNEWLYIMYKMEDKEWGAVFDVIDGEVCNVKYPKQEVAGSSCTFLEDIGGRWHIHSHHKMGAFNSKDDNDYVRTAYDGNIVLSYKGHMATQKVDLPCGGIGYKKVKIVLNKYTLPQNLFDNIIGEKKVETKVVTGYQYKGYENYQSGGNGDWKKDAQDKKNDLERTKGEERKRIADKEFSDNAKFRTENVDKALMEMQFDLETWCNNCLEEDNCEHCPVIAQWEQYFDEQEDMMYG